MCHDRGLFHVSCLLKAINTKYDLRLPTRTRAEQEGPRTSFLRQWRGGASSPAQPSPAQCLQLHYNYLGWARLLHQLIWRQCQLLLPSITMGRIIHCSDLILRIEDHQVLTLPVCNPFIKLYTSICDLGTWKIRLEVKVLGFGYRSYGPRHILCHFNP